MHIKLQQILRNMLHKLIPRYYRYRGKRTIFLVIIACFSVAYYLLDPHNVFDNGRKQDFQEGNFNEEIVFQKLDFDDNSNESYSFEEVKVPLQYFAEIDVPKKDIHSLRGGSWIMVGREKESQKTKDWVPVKPLPTSVIIRDKPNLPTCPDDFSPNNDNRVLDIFKKCAKTEKDFPPLLKTWAYKAISSCKSKFYGFDKELAYIKDVVVDVTGWSGIDYWNRIKNNAKFNGEMPKLPKGLFQFNCKHIPDYGFRSDSHLNTWLRKVTLYPDFEIQKVSREYRNVAIFIRRNEYQNLYHTISEIYNAYLVTRFFKLEPKKTMVVLMDLHPRTDLDSVWFNVFRSVGRLGYFTERTFFHEIIWNPLGYNSPLLDYSSNDIPLAESFSNFIAESYRASRSSYSDCDKLKITVLLRKNITSKFSNHTTDRQFHNENEIEETLQRTFPSYKIELCDFENGIGKYASLRTQLSLIAETDILIGIHGAGLTHAMFLPHHSGVIELIPNYWNKADGHFQGIARWQKLKYIRWKNSDPTIEFINKPGRPMHMPPDTLVKLVHEMKTKICKN